MARLTKKLGDGHGGAVVDPHRNNSIASGNTKIDGGRLSQVNLAGIQCLDGRRRIHPRELAVYQDPLRCRGNSRLERREKAGNGQVGGVRREALLLKDIFDCIPLGQVHARDGTAGPLFWMRCVCVYFYEEKALQPPHHLASFTLHSHPKRPKPGIIHITYKRVHSRGHSTNGFIDHQLIPCIQGCVGACKGQAGQAQNRPKASEDLEAHGNSKRRSYGEPVFVRVHEMVLIRMAS